MPTTHCLVPHPTEWKVLFVDTCSGGRLPIVESDDCWFAEAAGEVARELTAGLRLNVTALRDLSTDSVRVCEMENHSPAWALPTGAAWVDGDMVAQMECCAGSEGAAVQAIVLAWMSERNSGAVPAIRPPWERPGWYSTASAWIEESAARIRLPLIGPIEQVKSAWSWSSVLRAPTATGMLYFKANYPRSLSEPAMIEALARRWPCNVPRIVASDHLQHGMLMADFGPERLSTRPVARWQSAVRRFGGIQRECAADVPGWERIGVPDRRIAVLKQCTTTLLDDPAFVSVPTSGETAVPTLTPDEHTRLAALAPTLQALRDELGGIGIPDSIVQMDFREGNIAMRNRQPIFYDWSDTVISHPFFSTCRMLDYIWPSKTDHSRRLHWRERRRRIRNAYLEVWSECAPPDKLLHTFRLARQLSSLFLAIRWYLEIPHCEPESPWGRRDPSRAGTFSKERPE
jgi:hypothetical protein